VIEGKYLEMFEQLSRTPCRTLEPLPGWLERRQKILPPAVEILAGLPSGPAGSADFFPLVRNRTA
jgi:hypothetical protein